VVIESLDGAVVLVTGGASGIGLAVAESFGSRGARIVITDRDRDQLDLTGRTLSFETMCIAMDVTDRDAWTEVRKRVTAELGPVDILVNNAGVAPTGRPIVELSYGDWDRVVGINLGGVVNGVATFAAAMRDRGRGHIVNTASMGGLTAIAGIGDYVSSKFGVIGLTETLRLELAPFGVGVSAVAPGQVSTRLHRHGDDDGPDPLAGAMDAGAVGELVVQGVLDDTPYIVTHPEAWPIVQERFERLRDAFRGC
jgi:NAD(P)-dependent dehydrogenase (short-subunit alcohol dehydrogenase family)